MVRIQVSRCSGAGSLSFVPGRAPFGQGPTLAPESPILPGGERSLLGPSPGALPRGLTESLVVNRKPLAGVLVPRSRASTGDHGAGAEADWRARTRGDHGPAESAAGGNSPVRAVGVSGGKEDEGPPGGLALDQAIERLVHENLALRARSLELPQAEADILTASLRANPLLYADSQLIPYGSYSRERPGGPIQYDVNITYPIDVTHKRRHGRSSLAAPSECSMPSIKMRFGFRSTTFT